MRKMFSLLLAFLFSVTLTLGAMSCKKKEEIPPAKAPAVEEKAAPAVEEKAAPAVEEKAAPAVEEKAAPAETAPATESK